MVDEPTEEDRLKFVRSYGVEPVDVNTDLTFKDAATAVAEMTPIIGDAMAAKEVYDELMKDEPNYGLIAALGGAALVGAVPGIGDAAAAGIRKAVDVAKRVEVDPDAVGMMGGNIRIKPKVEEGTPTVEAAGLTDEAIEAWRKENATSEDFRKSLKGRNEELQDLAAGVEEGRVFTSTYRKRADELRPIRKVEEVPEPATFVEAVSALNAGKRKKPMIGLNASIPEGDIVTARLDIDAYTDYDVWVPTLTHPELKTVYKPSVILEDVSFIKPEGREPKKALGVAKGGAKAPFAVMTGKYVDATDDEAYKLAKDVFDNDDVTQVGYDPTRRGFFYDRETGEPIIEADAVIQVGHLVLAKNAKKMDAEAFGFSEGGMALEDQMEMNFGNVPDNTVGIDPVSGNEIPMGATAENVRDDIPANLSEGELVMPADVVNYWGVKFFEDLRAEAKRGFNEMNADGRIGGEPMMEESVMGSDIDVDLSMDDLEVAETMGAEEPVQMRKGGLARLGKGPTLGERRRAYQARQAAKSAAAHKANMERLAKNKNKDKRDRSFAAIRERAQANKNKPKTRWEALFGGGDKKEKKKTKLDFGFSGNPMERAARKYGGAEAKKPTVYKPDPQKGVNIRGDNSQAIQNLTEAGASAIEGITSGAKAAGRFLGNLFDEGGLVDDPTFAQKGGFDLDMEGAIGTQPILEMREYMNAAGHRIFITFINGEPQMAIPEGYFPVGEAETMTMEEEVPSSGRDKDDDPAIEPVPYDYKELSIDELQEEVEKVVMPSITIIDHLGKSLHRNQLMKEIDRRLEEPDLAVYEKEYLENLKTVSQNPKPSLLSSAISKLTGQEQEQPDLPNLTGPKYDMLPNEYGVVEAYTPDIQTSDAKTPFVPESKSNLFTDETISAAEKISREAAEKAFGKSKPATAPKPEYTEPSKDPYAEDRRDSVGSTKKPKDADYITNVATMSPKSFLPPQVSTPRGGGGRAKGGLVDRPKVKEVVKGLEKASKSHSKQAAKLKKALGAKKNNKKSK